MHRKNPAYFHYTSLIHFFLINLNHKAALHFRATIRMSSGFTISWLQCLSQKFNYNCEWNFKKKICPAAKIAESWKQLLHCQILLQVLVPVYYRNLRAESPWRLRQLPIHMPDFQLKYLLVLILIPLTIFDNYWAVFLKFFVAFNWFYHSYN